MCKLISVASYNILAIFPENTPSHFKTFEPILNELARKGHNMTVVSCFSSQEKSQNYIDITIDNCNVFSGFFQKWQVEHLQLFGKSNRIGTYIASMIVNAIGLKICKTLMESKGLEEIILNKNNTKFDILLTEDFNTNCGAALAKNFHCPVVRLHSTIIMPWSHERYGNPLNPAYIPNHFLQYSHKWPFLAP